VYLWPTLISVQPNRNNSKINAQPKDHPDATTDSSELEKLAALPYTNWSSSRTDVSKFGVLSFDHSKASDGLNLYNSRNLSEAYLMDMNGKIVHRWSVPEEDNSSWHTIHAMKNGDLFAIVKDQKLLKLSWDSKIIWEYKARVHHDVAISADGLIYVPTRRPEMWIKNDYKIPVVKELITVLNEKGQLVKEMNLFDALSPFISAERIEKIRTWASKEDIPARLKRNDVPGATWWENKKADVFHLNSIEFIDRNIDGIAEKGDLLLSIRQLDLICVFRPRTGNIVWSWGPGEIQCQHHARFLDNGHILLFDNGCKRGYSRSVEVDTGTKQIVWEYKASDPKEFFSRTRGGVQRLPNGNTLITESDHGRVFEITPEEKIVWEFLNPDVLSEKKKRAVIYRMIRIPRNFIER